MSEIHQILEKYWGYKSFRPSQEEIINSILSGKDTLALLPTGGGKSICFQVPALQLDGICIVITPLIALMKDQVENLKKRGIKAVALFSGMSKREIDITLDNCIYGDIKFLYCSPERLKTEIFIERAKKMNIGLLAVDEAHCISQWGYDFRPPYLEISIFRTLIPNVPCIALTATATIGVCKDIQEKLSFDEDNIFRKSFARANLSYSAFYTENKETKLLEILHNVAGTSIVYVKSRNRTKQIAHFLQQNHISADYYHAGLTGEIRERQQENWINNKIRVIVSTNAFGMGIDKPDVRTVIHLDIPDNPEAYYQEAGRVGRDEKLAYAVLLYNNADLENLKEHVEITNPPVKTIKQTYQAICNYYSLAIGSAFMESFDFDIGDFCNQYKLPTLHVYHSLKKLESQGLIQLNESFSVRSKLFFTVDNKVLYKFQIANKHLDNFIKLLLRIYGGELFNNHLNISEKDIAQKSGLPVNQVIEKLNTLHNHDIIDYVKQSNTPKITFLTPRADANKLPLNVTVLNSQKKEDLKKVMTMISYCKSDHRCRTLMLLEYFDEISDKECKVCDFCLKKKKAKKRTDNFHQIRNHIVDQLKTDMLNIHSIKQNLMQFNKEELGNVIAEMLDANEIFMDEEGNIGLN